MLDKVTSCLSLFNVLEREELLTPIQVKTMEQLIETTGDEELLDYLYQYKNRNLGSMLKLTNNQCDVIHVLYGWDFGFL